MTDLLRHQKPHARRLPARKPKLELRPTTADPEKHKTEEGQDDSMALGAEGAVEQAQVKEKRKRKPRLDKQSRARLSLERELRGLMTGGAGGKGKRVEVAQATQKRTPRLNKDARDMLKWEREQREKKEASLEGKDIEVLVEKTDAMQIE